MKTKFLSFIAIVIAFTGGYLIGKKSVVKNVSEYDMIYAQFNGDQIRGEDVLKLVGPEIRDLEKSAYDIKKRTTEDLLRKKMNLPPNGTVLDGIKISSAEIDAVLKDRKLSRSQVSEKEINNIANNLKLQKAKQIEAERFSSKLEESKIRFHIPLPQLPRIKMDHGVAPARGPFWAPVEIIQVSNYHCGTCALAESHLQELNKKFENKLKIFFRYKGLDPKDSVAFLSVEASLCAQDQNQFWEFHDALFKQPPQTVAEISQIAQTLKIKKDQFDDCLKKRTHQKDVEADQLASQILPQETVPFLIINNQVISGLESVDVLSDLIESEL